MTKKNEKAKIATKERLEFLKCSLTKEEVAIAANDLAKLLDDNEALEDQLKSIKTDFKAKIEKSLADINIKKRLVRDKHEYRNVNCVIVHNYTTLRITTTRKDTGVVTEDRDMTMSERQMTMDFDKDK